MLAKVAQGGEAAATAAEAARHPLAAIAVFVKVFAQMVLTFRWTPPARRANP